MAERTGFSRDSFSGPFASPCGPVRAQPRLAKAQHAFGQTALTQAALPHEPRPPAPVLRLGHRRGLVRADDAVLRPGHLRPVGLPARLRGQRALFDGTGLAGLGPVLGLGRVGQRAAGVMGCRMRRLGFVAAGGCGSLGRGSPERFANGMIVLVTIGRCFSGCIQKHSSPLIQPIQLHCCRDQPVF